MSRLEALRAAFTRAGQVQVFDFWDELDSESRGRLLSQAAEIDIEEVSRLIGKHLKSDSSNKPDLDGLKPAPCISLPENGGDPDEWADAVRKGEESLRAGKVAAVTVAGGQGTRLGFDGPKGAFPITPVKKKCLFQVFAEKIMAAEIQYSCAIPWFIMTSHDNREWTETFLKDRNWFGIKPDKVQCFTQGRMPAVDYDGKILLENPGAIAMNPDGHGGSMRALVHSGAVNKMHSQGIEFISYFQVDNPLVRVIDPAFIGFHQIHDSEMSSKMVPKTHAGEKLGHFCDRGGRLVVVEYSDMPKELTDKIDEHGLLHFRAGSIAAHILSLSLVERLGRDQAGLLPFHRADKKIQTIDARGETIRPDRPNGVKFEMFIFDALPLARNPIVVETFRGDDFSPAKNASGTDSPQSCHDDQLRQFTRWARAAGIDIPMDDAGLPSFAFEVSSGFAVDEESFAAKWNSLAVKPRIEEGTYLE